MQIEILEENSDVLTDYEKISIAFEVKTIFRVEVLERGFGGIKLVEETIQPYLKDYDEYIDERPSRWPDRFDISNWGILSAYIDKQRIGGAVIAWNTPEIFMLEDRKDLACLWDLRVSPEFRGNQIGHRLFAVALEWAKTRGCWQLKVETQNTNVPACRFYVRQGCELGAINRFGYPDILNEIQLIWYRGVL